MIGRDSNGERRRWTRALSTTILFGLATALLAVGGSVAASGTLVLQPGEDDSGIPITSVGPDGTTLRFVERGTFWEGFIVQNSSSDQTITLTSASAPQPTGSIVSQTNFRFAPYTPCSGEILCLPFEPASSVTSHPLTLAPGASAAVKINYQLGTCNEAKSASFATGDTLVIDYLTGPGSSSEQSFPLAGSKLIASKPAGVECLPRPYSHIGLVGSFTTSPHHLPVPGSDGDTCTFSSGGKLSFESRYFVAADQAPFNSHPDGPRFRVEIDLPRFHGVGAYRKGSLVTVDGGFGNVGDTIFHDAAAPVTVTQATRSTVTGTLSAVLSGHRRFFHAYGTWRCTILRSP